MPAYADRGGNFAQTIMDPPRDAIYANFVFFYIHGVSLRLKSSQLCLEGIDFGGRVGR